MKTVVFDEFIAPVQVVNPKNGEMHRPILRIYMTVEAERVTKPALMLPRDKGRMERMICRAEREFFGSWTGESLCELESAFASWLKDKGVLL